MSSHDARFDDEQARDQHEEPGTTTTSTDQPDQPVDQDQAHDRAYDHGDTVADGGPVLLPVDAPEPTTDGGTAPDHAAVTIVDAGDPADTDRDRADVSEADPFPADPNRTDVTGDRTDVTGDRTDVTGDRAEVTTDPALDATLGPDTETGALKDPVPDGTFTAAPAPASTSTPGGSDDWRDLQGRFVDDPEEAVREAGARVEKALSELRSRIENGSTEDLRTAFRRYRDLHADLS